MDSPLTHQKVWFEKSKYDEAERQYFERLAKHLNKGPSPQTAPVDAVKSEVKVLDCHINNSKAKPPSCVPKSEVNVNTEPNSIEGVVNTVGQVKAKKVNNYKPPHERKNSGHRNKTPEVREQLENGVPKTEVNVNVEPNDADGAVVVNTASELKGKKLKYKTPEEKRNSRHRNKTPEVREQLRLKKKKKGGSPSAPLKNSLAGEVAKARQHIKNSLECMDGIAALATNVNVDLVNRMNSLENIVKDLQSAIQKLDSRVKILEKTASSAAPRPQVVPAPKQAPSKVQAPQDDEDDGVDLFASDSEEESDEAKKLKEQRLAEYAAKKSKKPALVAKSSIILEVKPWDDETDMKQMEVEVRKIEMDGLVWGASKLVPLAYGIHKLQITCVVEDDKVSVDLLQESIEALEDYVQSVDIAAFNKI